MALPAQKSIHRDTLNASGIALKEADNATMTCHRTDTAGTVYARQHPRYVGRESCPPPPGVPVRDAPPTGGRHDLRVGLGKICVYDRGSDGQSK